MIAAGIVVHQHEAQCRFEARGISAELHYYFGYSPERHPLDNPYGAIACRICGGRPLFVFHPEDSPADAPVFPPRAVRGSKA